VGTSACARALTPVRRFCLRSGEDAPRSVCRSPQAASRRSDELDGLAQLEQMLRSPIALKSAGDRLLGILTALISQRSQPLWIPLSTENRTNDSHASDPGDVRDHLRELDVHLLEGLLHVADMVRGVPHQHGTLAKITAQHADLIVGPERPGQKPKGMELLDPLAVEHIALSPRHVLQPARIDQLHLKTTLGQELKERNPIDARGFHRHGLDPTLPQPIGYSAQIRRRAPPCGWRPSGTAT